MLTEFSSDSGTPSCIESEATRISWLARKPVQFDSNGHPFIESNFPVDKGSYSYGVFWNACKLLAKGASAAEKADLFAGSAQRFYRLKTQA